MYPQVMRSKNTNGLKGIQKQSGGTENELDKHDPMCSKTKHTTNRERRGVSSMSKYIDMVLRESILPIALKTSVQQPSHTKFYFTEQDTMQSIISGTIMHNCPTLFESKANLLSAVSAAYDNIKATSAACSSKS